jgi:uncharacterized protein
MAADDRSLSRRERSRPPARAWALAELVLAGAILAAALAGYVPFSPTPWLLVVATASLWWRGPGWRGIGLKRPDHELRVLIIGIATGIGYQFFGLYVVEPLIAVVSGRLPDASMFRSVIGDERRLAFWLVMSWTLAAFMEEMVYRGWIMTRLAELGRFSTTGWTASVLASSALFGAAHLYQGVSGVIATGLTGLVFALVYLASGRNLWASILAHGFLDTAGFVLIYLGVYPGL